MYFNEFEQVITDKNNFRFRKLEPLDFNSGELFESVFLPVDFLFLKLFTSQYYVKAFICRKWKIRLFKIPYQDK